MPWQRGCYLCSHKGLPNWDGRSLSARAVIKTPVHEHHLWQHGGAVVAFPAPALFDTCDFVPRVAPNVIQSHQGTEYDDGWFACKVCSGVVAVHHTRDPGHPGYAVLGGPHSVVNKSCAQAYFALPIVGTPNSAPQVLTPGATLGETAAGALDGAWQCGATAAEQYELAVAMIKTSESDSDSDPESLPDLVTTRVRSLWSTEMKSTLTTTPRTWLTTPACTLRLLGRCPPLRQTLKPRKAS
jgi:hypothetical protein